MVRPTRIFDRIQWLREAVGESGRARLRGGRPLERPVQVEIHPYWGQQERPCSNDCVWCTRGCDRERLLQEKARGIDPDRLIRFIRALRPYSIREVALAGNCTEPLLYPRIADVIRAIKSIGAGLRLYTNFQNGNAVISVAEHLTQEDLVRISLDAGSDQSYVATHRPHCPGAFDRVLDNMERLLNKRRENQRHFFVIVTYLINEQNARAQDIEFIVRWTTKHGVDAVHFIRPLAPYGRLDGWNPLPEEQAQDIQRRISGLRARLDTPTEILFRLTSSVQESRPFHRCHYWKMAAVLGSRGLFFPCTSTAVAEYAKTFGQYDVNAANFDFARFWNDAQKWKEVNLSACPECTRAEFAFNAWVEHE